MFPSNSYIEALTQNVTAFGDRPFKEVIKLKGGHKCGSNMTSSFYKKRKRHQGVHTQRKGHVRSRGEGSLLKAKAKTIDYFPLNIFKDFDF